MCVIVDNNAFKLLIERSEECKVLYEWIMDRKIKLIVGGELYDELKGVADYKIWIKILEGKGYLVIEEEGVAERTKELKKRCKSNDAHVIALAQVAGARLLYSNDRKLHKDFKNKDLLSGPRGKVFPDGGNDKKQRRILRENLCSKS